VGSGWGGEEGSSDEHVLHKATPPASDVQRGTQVNRLTYFGGSELCIDP